MIGFKIIGEMTRDELVDEFLAHQREEIIKQTTDDIKKVIINMRMVDVNRRMVAEAKLEPTTLWGIMNGNSDSDD